MATMLNVSQSQATNKGYYHYLFYELADPRTNDWFLISDPWPGLAIIGFYLYFVLSLGPRLMRNRKPFDLKRTLIVYNFIQVLISLFIFYNAIVQAWGWRYSWRCEPVDFSYDQHAMLIATFVHFYFLVKISELLDTVFFVLRKKDNQITFLHLYHHTVMPMISWGCTKYYPGGHSTFIGFINSFVHIIMYAYYLLAACGPKLQKYLWWKKYITTLQLLQFCIAFIHSMQLLFYDCGYPRWSMFFTLPNAIFFYYLFNDFYNKAYNDREKPSKTIETSQKNDFKEDCRQQNESLEGKENGHVTQNEILLDEKETPDILDEIEMNKCKSYSDNQLLNNKSKIE